MEGASGRQGSREVLHPSRRGVRIGQHLGRCDPLHTNALALQPPIPAFVVRLPRQMSDAIDLDAEPGGLAVEVDDIGTHGMLPAEDRRAGLAAFQARPQ